MQHPEREAFEAVQVGPRVGGLDVEAGHHRLGLGDRHSGAQAERLRGRIGRRHHPAVLLLSGDDQRRLTGRRCRPPSAATGLSASSAGRQR